MAATGQQRPCCDDRLNPPIMHHTHVVRRLFRPYLQLDTSKNLAISLLM